MLEKKKENSSTNGERKFGSCGTKVGRCVGEEMGKGLLNTNINRESLIFSQ